MRNLAVIIACCGTILCSVGTQAQDAPAVPEAMPFHYPMGTPVNLERAKSVAAAAEAEAKRHGWEMAISIVEPNGELVYYEKLDGTQYGSIAIAESKARTAARLERPTKIFADIVNGKEGQAGMPAVISLGIVTIEGGVPLIEDGKLVGAIGVSGGASVQDGVVARAGAAVLH